jgi:hypothetical protein
MQWQPISTAPKDERWILVARRNEQGVAFWRSGYWHLGGVMYFNNPTHWMPLPDPPA